MKPSHKKTIRRGNKLPVRQSLECKLERLLAELCGIKTRLDKLEKPIMHWWNRVGL